MERSAVFMVPRMWRFAGKVKGSPEWGSVTAISFAAPARLSSSRSVMSSPITLETLARLISSMTSTWGSLFARARSAMRLSTPAVGSRLKPASPPVRGRRPSTNSSYP